MLRRFAFAFLALSISTGSLGCAADTADSDDGDDEAGGESAASSESAIAVRGFAPPSYGQAERESVLEGYAHLDRGGVVPRDLLEDAVLFFHANNARLRNKAYLTVVDFSKHSREKRLFVVDMKSGSVRGHVVAHGSGSDPGHTGYATKFSNVSGSNASSLGYYVTAETYSGKHGRSLRLDGVSSTNSNARARAVVIHGASYVSEGRSKQGRSWGCPAIPSDVKDQVISAIDQGSLLYIGRSKE